MRTVKYFDLFFAEGLYIIFSIFLVFFFGKLLKLATGKVICCSTSIPEGIIAVVLYVCSIILLVVCR